MECPSCGKDTPSHARYCQYCGNALDLDFTVVEQSMAVEVEQEAIRRTELRFRGYLLFALVFLAIAIGFAIIVQAPPNPSIYPVYLGKENGSTSIKGTEIQPLSLPIPTE